VRQHAVAEVARLKSRPPTTYTATLNARYAAQLECNVAAGVAPGAPGSPLDAIAAELAALKSRQWLRAKCAAALAQCVAALAQWPAAVPRHARTLVAELHAYREVAANALSTLEMNPGQLEDWTRKINEMPEDVDSPTGRADAHFKAILPLLARARGLDGILEQLDALWRDLEEHAAVVEAQLAPASDRGPVGYAVPDPPPDPPRRAVRGLSA
jgi:hypothetical protein